MARNIIFVAHVRTQHRIKTKLIHKQILRQYTLREVSRATQIFYSRFLVMISQNFKMKLIVFAHRSLPQCENEKKLFCVLLYFYFKQV